MPAARTTPTHGKVVVIGNIGAGKTTLAQALARTLGLPVTALDDCRRQHGDGTAAGEAAAWAAFLTAAGSTTSAILECTGVGPFASLLRHALAKSGTRVAFLLLRAPIATCLERIRSRTWGIPYPEFGVPLPDVVADVDRSLAAALSDTARWPGTVTTIEGSATPPEVLRAAAAALGIPAAVGHASPRAAPVQRGATTYRAPWQRAVVAPEGTHHLFDTTPLYSPRLVRVLPFHEPGLAPAEDATGWTHIDPHGRAAYEERYLRAFGYYEGRAAVADRRGWLFLDTGGRPISDERYAWAGNFQGGRATVRFADGRYAHVRPDGRPAYDARYRYAGDFREGVAVVQADDGRSTHLDAEGRLVHGRWYLDLDVFHKGYARARDEAGWTHLDRHGAPVYARRFVAVEPFYNGQARVENPDGSLEVIDEAGHTQVELRSPRRSEFHALSRDLVGFWRTQAACAAVELGVIERLPGTASAVAAAARLDPDRTRRLLQALGEMGLVALAGERWSLTVRGEYLRRDQPESLAHAAIEYGRPMSALWATLPRAIQGGEDWRPPNVFAQVALDPQRARGHHEMLRSYARHDYRDVPAALRLRGDEVVIDAGGGLGVLAELMARQYGRLTVHVLDRPEVGGLVSVPADLRHRLSFHAADLFAPWPVRSGAVVLARVVHDWDDEPATRILRRAREALPVGGQLYLVEMVRPREGFAGALCDLHLLTVTGGRERNAAEYTALLEAAGFALGEVRHLAALPSIVVGTAR